MPVDYEALEKAVRARFEKDVLNWTVSHGMPILHIRRGAVVEVLKFLRDDESTKFNVLTDVTCVDYLKAPAKMEADTYERFAVVYQLTSLENMARFRVKAWVPEEPCEIDSATSLWKAANWGEREVYDMFGILFKGHPDLRRILMPENYEGHPLRKDYPLKGRGERDNFPKFHELTKES